ncbi:hypothetical protein BC835DRAFT_1338146 [Cytidiella melzeri]|nr:hypothetical protein BC835DRAFT_1338146 [Cytidiella melzeri]
MDPDFHPESSDVPIRELSSLHRLSLLMAHRTDRRHDDSLCSSRWNPIPDRSTTITTPKLSTHRLGSSKEKRGTRKGIPHLFFSPRIGRQHPRELLPRCASPAVACRVALPPRPHHKRSPPSSLSPHGTRGLQMHSVITTHGLITEHRYTLGGGQTDLTNLPTRVQ